MVTSENRTRIHSATPKLIQSAQNEGSTILNVLITLLETALKILNFTHNPCQNFSDRVTTDSIAFSCLQQYSRNVAKADIYELAKAVQTSGNSGVMYALHLWLIRKLMVDFLFATIELFLLSLTVKTLQAEICQTQRFLKGLSHF